MVAVLLFLALAFFAVGKAGATRNGAQSAADAAALAAAQQSRDDFARELVAGILDPAFLQDVFAGHVTLPLGDACGAAAQFAERNRADLSGVGCSALGAGRWGFHVQVTSQNPVGKSVLPGTENKRAVADATAVVEPRCTFEPNDEATEPPATDAPPAPPGDGGQSPEPVSPGEIHCPENLNVTIDPENPGELPDMADLFTVHLADN